MRAGGAEYQRWLRRPDGACIAYRVCPAAVAADAAGPALALVHGLASNLTRWSEFVENTSLKDRHDLIRIDLRGHGESPTRRAVGLERWCDDLAAVLQREGHAKAIVVGHSLGAQVALHFAARHPQRSAGLVLIDPVFRQALHGRWKLLALAGPLLRAAAATVRALNAIGLHRRTLPALDLRALDAMARQALASPDAEAAFVRQYSSMRADLRYVPLAVYLQDLVEMFRPVLAPQSLHAPMLVLLSSGATFADAGATRALLRRIPRVELQTIDCHHWPLTERPQEVRRAIERWCAGLS